jgi:hypothetical protein
LITIDFDFNNSLIILRNGSPPIHRLNPFQAVLDALHNLAGKKMKEFLSLHLRVDLMNRSVKKFFSLYFRDSLKIDFQNFTFSDFPDLEEEAQSLEALKEGFDFEEFSSNLKSLLASSLRNLPAALLLFSGGNGDEMKDVCVHFVSAIFIFQLNFLV